MVTSQQIEKWPSSTLYSFFLFFNYKNTSRLHNDLQLHSIFTSPKELIHSKTIMLGTTLFSIISMLIVSQILSSVTGRSFRESTSDKPYTEQRMYRYTSTYNLCLVLGRNGKLEDITVHVLIIFVLIWAGMVS